MLGRTHSESNSLTGPAFARAERDGVTVAVAGLPFPAATAASPAQAVADAYLARGVESLREYGGSFAIVVSDARTRTTHLVTDMLGSDSIYYTRHAGRWSWSTRLSDLVGLNGPAILDDRALAETLCFRFFSGARTLFDGIRQVPPGSLVSLADGGDVAVSAARRPGDFIVRDAVSLPDGVTRLDAALTQSLRDVRAQHSAVTVFLSGGLDSSVLLAKTLEAGFTTVRCCTAIFPGWDNPELPLARRVAAHLGTSLEEIPVSSADVSALFAPAVSAMEEPPRHYKIFALWKLYDYAAREAPLVISGIGAENVFGPKAVKWLRVNARRAEAFRRVPLAWRRRLARMLPRSRSGRLALVRNLACCDGERDLFAFLILCDERLPHTAFARGIPDVPTPGDEFWASYIDGLPTFEDRQQVYGLLTEDKPDMQSRVRIGGAFGVNTVHPFLSIEALRVGLAQPVADRLRDGWSKPLVRELACRYFPRDWIYCEKFGFPTPLGAWMDGPLKPRVDMLEDGRDAVPGLWRPDVLAQCRQERNHEVLWGAMTLEFLLRRAQGRADDGLTPMPGRA